MKDQYIGDIGDYGKYGLLRHLSENGADILVNWYLTENDGSADGKHTAYLDDEKRFRRYDSELFDILKKLVYSGNRSITSFERENCIDDASYYHTVITPGSDRKEWHRNGLLAAAGKSFVFLDPDNGLTEKTKSAKESVKFCFADEVADYYNTGVDVLYYCQRDRSPADVWHSRLRVMQGYLPDACIRAVTCHRGTQRAYVFVLHRESEEKYSRIIDEFIDKWAGFFTAECISSKEKTEDVIKPGRYRHYKGNEYEVLFTAKHSETEELMVVYKALYGDGQIWVRPASMWNETVIKNGKERKRFTYQSPF